jgi:hypothetical protein
MNGPLKPGCDKNALFTRIIFGMKEENKTIKMLEIRSNNKKGNINFKGVYIYMTLSTIAVILFGENFPP